MACVSLDDDELIELLLERPHVLSAAFERLIQERDQGREDASSAFNYAQQWKKKAIAAGATPTLASPNPNPTLLG